MANPNGAERSLGSKVRATARVLLGISALAGGGAVLEGCGSSNSLTQAEQQATQKYDQAYSGASPAGKFALQYLDRTEVTIHKDSGSAIESDSGHEWQITVNNGCLGGSAYNVDGGSITASANADGLFSSSSASVNAQSPAAAAYAYVNSTSPDVLTVHSGHVDSVDLHFTGVKSSSPLVPEDQPTLNVLDTYGCKLGVVDHSVFDQLDAPDSSAWIR